MRCNLFAMLHQRNSVRREESRLEDDYMARLPRPPLKSFVQAPLTSLVAVAYLEPMRQQLWGMRHSSWPSPRGRRELNTTLPFAFVLMTQTSKDLVTPSTVIVPGLVIGWRIDHPNNTMSFDLSQLPALQPPPGVVPDFTHPHTRGPLFLAPSAVAMGIMYSFVIVRFYTKLFLKRKPT